MNAQQLLAYVIRPTLQFIELWSTAAEQLVLGTALVESRGVFIKQVGKGPALGLWQMEPRTHDDIWENYLKYKPKLKDKLHQLATVADVTRGAQELIGNLYYGAAMCRVHYARYKVVTAADAAKEMADAWKAVYNTVRGAGTVSKALPHFEAACAVIA